MRVLQEHDPERAVQIFFRLQDKMLQATLLVLGSLPGGANCIAALLAVMSPVQACRYDNLCTHHGVPAPCKKTDLQKTFRTECGLAVQICRGNVHGSSPEPSRTVEIRSQELSTRAGAALHQTTFWTYCTSTQYCTSVSEFPGLVGAYF